MMPTDEGPILSGLDIQLEVHSQRLKNGLEVLLLQDTTLPTVSYYTFVKVGSRVERQGTTGISHLFEHMMFNGATRYGPKAFDRLLEASGGYSNAYTSKDMTVYYEYIPSDKLEVVVDLESDRMEGLRLDAEILEAERSVVKEERRLRTDNSIFGVIQEQLYALAFQVHSYHWPIIGWMGDLDNISLQDCETFFRTYYAPNNVLIVVAGDIDLAQTETLLARYYEEIPRQSLPSLPNLAEPEQKGERRAEYHRPAQLPAVAIGYRVPAANHEDLYPLDILQMVLAHGESSRLYRKLVYEEQVALGFYSSFGWSIDPGLFYFYIQMNPGFQPSEAEQLIYAELSKIQEQGITAEESRKAKNMLQALFVKDLKTNGGKAEKIGTYHLLFEDWSYLSRTLEAYEAVPRDDVRRVAQNYFMARQRSVVTLVPEKSNGAGGIA